MIEELKDTIIKSEDGYEISHTPTIREIADKVNEIVRELNKRGDIE